MKLNKLDSIENLSNLNLLNISSNRIRTLHKLKSCEKLTFLDASANKLIKIDELPINLFEINLSNNTLTSLQFCSKLEVLKIIF